MSIIQKLIKRFKAHTPEKWRKLGQRLLKWSVAIAIPPELIGYTKIAFIIFGIGLVGRALVEFTEDAKSD